MTTAVAAPGGQLARYLVVGVTNTAISFAVYALLAAAGLPYVPAAAVAFAAGAVNGYVLNRRWTFSAPDSARARIAYVCVQAAGALATGALVWLLAHETAAGRIGAYVVAVPGHGVHIRGEPRLDVRPQELTGRAPGSPARPVSRSQLPRTRPLRTCLARREPTALPHPGWGSCPPATRRRRYPRNAHEGVPEV